MAKHCEVTHLRVALKAKPMDSSALRDALANALNAITSSGRPEYVQRVVDCLVEHVAQDGEATEKKTAIDPAVDAADDSDEAAFARVAKAVAAIKTGGFVVVADAGDRENEGDLIIAAEMATSEKLAFMVNQTSGLICVGVAPARLDELKLPQMVDQNTEHHGTAFTVSVDLKFPAAQGKHTGISASDRAATIRAIADPEVKAEQFSRPGHMFPLRYRDGGVLVRPGHTEASVDLARLAGLFPAGAMCEIVNKDGTMMRPPQCRKFAEDYGLPFLSIADLVRFRKVFPRFPASAESFAIGGLERLPALAPAPRAIPLPIPSAVFQTRTVAACLAEA